MAAVKKAAKKATAKKAAQPAKGSAEWLAMKAEARKKLDSKPR